MDVTTPQLDPEPPSHLPPGTRSYESGFTLVESLVAMTLFISVLIPLIGLVGNVLLVSDSSRIGRALAVAQVAMQKEGNASENTEGFAVNRTETFQGSYRAVTVIVLRDGKNVVTLFRLLERR